MTVKTWLVPESSIYPRFPSSGIIHELFANFHFSCLFSSFLEFTNLHSWSKKNIDNFLGKPNVEPYLINHYSEVSNRHDILFEKITCLTTNYNLQVHWFLRKLPHLFHSGHFSNLCIIRTPLIRDFRLISCKHVSLVEYA